MGSRALGSPWPPGCSPSRLAGPTSPPCAVVGIPPGWARCVLLQKSGCATSRAELTTRGGSVEAFGPRNRRRPGWRKRPECASRRRAGLGWGSHPTLREKGATKGLPGGRKLPAEGVRCGPTEHPEVPPSLLGTAPCTRHCWWHLTACPVQVTPITEPSS